MTKINPTTASAEPCRDWGRDWPRTWTIATSLSPAPPPETVKKAASDREDAGPAIIGAY